MKKKRCLSVVIISLLLGISCFIMAGCANKDNEDKDDTKIEQNLDKKEDAEDFNKKDEEADENKKVEEDEDEDENSREARVYYVDDITGEIMGKTITVKTEYPVAFGSSPFIRHTPLISVLFLKKRMVLPLSRSSSI